MNSLAEAYREASYFVDLDGEAIEIAVGHAAPQLEAQLGDTTAFAYITACNPGSQLQSATWNQHADGELRMAIDAHGVRRWPMTSSSPDGHWWESGWLIGDLSHSMLDDLAKRFGQTGVLLWQRGEPVRLRMYGAIGSPHPQTDWIE